VTQNKVLLVLVDGMRPDSIAACGNPAYQKYFEEGAHSYGAQTTFPPVTLPAHMSLFHSVPSERHGVTTNHYIENNHPINGLIEVIANAGKKSGFFYCWEQLRNLCTPGKHLSYSWFMSWNAYKWMDIDRRATKACKEYIAEFQPDFAFLYLGETDEYGHNYGWMGPEYLNCVKTAEDCILDIASFLPPEYSVIVTADHGGHDRNHGENIPEDMTIPITCHGPMFEKGSILENASIIDIAPTITEILGIPADPDWEGKSLIPNAE